MTFATMARSDDRPLAVLGPVPGSADLVGLWLWDSTGLRHPAGAGPAPNVVVDATVPGSVELLEACAVDWSDRVRFVVVSYLEDSHVD